MQYERVKLHLPALVKLSNIVHPARRDLLTDVDDCGTLDVLKGYAHSLGFAVHGQYNESGRKEGHITWKGNEQYPYPHIFVDERYSRGNQTHVLLHELAHEATWQLGWVFNEKDEADKEVIAEATAALISYETMQDITTHINAAAYIAYWRTSIPESDVLMVTNKLIDSIMEYITWS